MADYFIQVNQQDKFRIDLLTVQKQLLDCLKRCELFKQIRSEKIKEIENLRQKLKELTTLCDELKTQMPKAKIAKLKTQEKAYSREKKPQSFYDYSKELEKLSGSIEEIESKLQELDK
ncbi:hypothetical protein HOH15_02070 [Candidatus Woesearchaeota archaeon]|nr:hypothetical protein [Candidatus Woesearchaeota archaeon]